MMRVVLWLLLLLFLITVPLSAAQTEEHGCMDCRGQKIVVCGNCEGKGEASLDARHSRSQVVPCVKCKATGKRVCFTCGGAGTLVEYPAADAEHMGYLKLHFEVRARKRKPAPSWIEVWVDGQKKERIEGKGRNRVYDFKEIALWPGDRHRLKLLIHFARGLAGYYDGEVIIHGVRIESGKLTTTEGSKRGPLPRDDERVEDWSDVYRGMFQTMEESKAFRIIPRGN